MKAKNLLIGIIIFLAVLNVATIATVIILINRTNTPDDVTSTISDTSIPLPNELPATQTARYLGQRLNLSVDQQESFRQASMNYNRNARLISLEMGRLRDELLEEMDRNVPDTVMLGAISEEIGRHHVELKRLTIDHYLSLKQLCNEEQKRELYLLFKTILNPDGEISTPRGQGQSRDNPRGRGRQGRGPWWNNQADSVTK
jgi:uncharacterized membrane protein